MDSTPWSLDHRRTSPNGSQYDSGMQSPEHSLPDSLDHMSFSEHSQIPQMIPANHSDLMRMVSQMSPIPSIESTAPQISTSTDIRPMSLQAIGNEMPDFQYPYGGLDLNTINGSGSMFNDQLLTTGGAGLTYPTTSTANSGQPMYAAGHSWLPGATNQYVDAFRPTELYMYHATPGSSGGSINSSSYGYSLHQPPSPTENSPGSMRATRSFSHDSLIFPGGLSPQSAGFTEQDFNLSNHAAAASVAHSPSYMTDDSYVFVSSPSRESSGSPILVSVDPTSNIPTSPTDSNSSHRRRKETARKTSRSSVTKAHDEKASAAFMKFSFPSEKAYPIRVSKDSKNGKKIGGRCKGSHLDPETAEHARLMRTMGNCWVCIFQREKCTVEEGSNVCTRCKNRHERGIMVTNGHLGCVNHKLSFYHNYVVPDVLKAPYGVQATVQYENVQVCSFLDRRPITVELSLLWMQAPIQVNLFEYQPQHNQEVTIQWKLDKDHDRYIKKHTQSVPLALGRDAWEHDDVSPYEEYLDSIVNDREKLMRFGDSCYSDFTDNFLQRLFQIFMIYEPSDQKEEALLKDMYKMLLAAHIIGHVAYFSPEALSTLPPAHRAFYEPDEIFATPYLANRQIKTIFLKILDKVVKTVLDKQQSILRGSNSKPKWMGAFMCMLGMALACEEVQSTTEMVGAKDDLENVFGCSPSAARAACDVIDDTFVTMCSLFHMKYKSFNPLKNTDTKDVGKEIGEASLPIIRQIKALCEEKHSTYMHNRMYATVSQENLAKYYGRLVSRFLAGFWTADN